MASGQKAICTASLALLFMLIASGASFADPICESCYKSFLKLDLSQVNEQAPGVFSVNVVADAQYFDASIMESGRGISNDITSRDTKISFPLANATNASLVFKYDGNYLVDSSGQNIICAPVQTGRAGTADAGRATCQAMHYKNPVTGEPQLISQGNRCGLLEVSLVRSLDNAKVKPTKQNAIICPQNANKIQSLWPIMALWGTNPAFFVTCLPGFIVLGLLLASMYYSGKNPLSLFDITTPRLPQGKKVRMPKAALPLGLAHKARINDKLISRSEKAIETQLARLYKRMGANYSNIAAMQKELREMFSKSASKYDDIRKLVLKHAHASGASQSQINAAIRSLDRLLDIRTAAHTDKAIYSFARAGGPADYILPKGMEKLSPFYKMKDKYGRNWQGALLMKYSGKFGKPWKFIPGIEHTKVGKALNYLPGIPYVERLMLVGSNWFGSRAGHSKMRKEIRRAFWAETKVALKLTKPDSDYVKKYGFAYKRIGSIPKVIERMHQESVYYARSIQDEVLNRLMVDLSMEFNRSAKGGAGKQQLKLIEDRIREVYLAIQRIERERVAAANSGKDYDYHIKLMNELLKIAERHNLINYRKDANGDYAFGDGSITENRIFSRIDIDDAAALRNFGRKYMTHAELEAWLRILRSCETEIRGAASIANNTLDKDGRKVLLLNKDGTPIKLDPNDVYSRYKRIYSLLEGEYFRADWDAGKVPMIYFSHDLGEVMGRILRKTDADYQKNPNDAYRMARIRMAMEQEIALKKFFNHMAELRDFDKDKAGMPNSAFNKQWRDVLANIRNTINPANIGREAPNYAMRGEVAARHFITGYTASLYGYSYEAERNKVEALRQYMADLHGKSLENLFRNYSLNYERNIMIYDTLKATSKIYNGTDKWDWETYLEWQKRGVTYGDMRKGVWVIDAGNKTMRPLAAPINIEDAINNNKFKYNTGELARILTSDYSERWVNASALIYNEKSKKWERGAPLKDPDIRRLVYECGSEQGQLFNLRVLEGGLTSEKEGRDRMKAINDNRAQLEKLLNERVKIMSRYEYGQTGSWWSKASQSFAQFLERGFMGGVHNTNQRFNQWYASQAYTRTLLDSFGPISEESDPYFKETKRRMSWKWKDEDGGLLSDETHASFEAKRKLAKAREDQLRILASGNIGSAEQAELNRIRREIPALEKQVKELEKAARQSDKRLGGADRAIRDLAEMTVQYYNANEMTVMRDPRVAIGAGYGMKPAVMVGYQTGQFIAERPSIWTAFNVMPGDLLVRQLAKPAYWASLGFGAFNRTFFTKSMGYTTVYNSNPESGGEFERYHLREAIQSIFRPSQSFDLFTRLHLKPIWRGFGAWKSEFGTSLVETHTFSGARAIMPFSFKSPGNAVDSQFRVDETRAKLAGQPDMDRQIRQMKLGLSFRDEYKMWEERTFQMDPTSRLASLKGQLKSAGDATERRMIDSEIRQVNDAVKAQRKIWSIPGLRAFFQSGYYAIENRAGYDISAQGGAHRPWELYSAYHKNFGGGGIVIPGMLYSSSDGEKKVFPRVAAMLLDAPGYGSPMGSDNQIDPKSNMRRLIGIASTAEPGRIGGGIGIQELARDSVRDVYRHEKNALYHFMELEQERMGYSLLNSPFVMPLAPLYIGAYQIAKKFRYVLRNWSMATENIYDKPYSESEGMAKAAHTRQAQMDAQIAGQSHWICSTHSIQVQINHMCPLCHNREEDLQSKQKLHAAWARGKHMVGDWAKSYALSWIPTAGYNYYMNRAHCPTHQISYDRGTTCPMCKDPKLSDARQMVKCAIHNVHYEAGMTCWKCTSREPTVYEQIQDTRPAYRRKGRDSALDAYRKQIDKQMKEIKSYEDQNRYEVA